MFQRVEKPFMKYIGFAFLNVTNCLTINKADSDIEGSPKYQDMHSSDEAEFSTARIV
ncbi:3360_t:CDS:2 [Funneliformis caledonium]|uniref:3360_t:CDS:1 n=1 Tax=Funneliformis caledonium TaxID=1117310 RepID=A0A9N8YS24_9GLOM|nr:3360_t:CDS:2 [Funneliformis caledonium]